MTVRDSDDPLYKMLSKLSRAVDDLKRHEHPEPRKVKLGCWECTEDTFWQGVDGAQLGSAAVGSEEAVVYRGTSAGDHAVASSTVSLTSTTAVAQQEVYAEGDHGNADVILFAHSGNTAENTDDGSYSGTRASLTMSVDGGGQFGITLYGDGDTKFNFGTPPVVTDLAGLLDLLEALGFLTQS